MSRINFASLIILDYGSNFMKRVKSKILILLLAIAVSVPAASGQWSIGLQMGASNNSLQTESSYAYDRHYTSVWMPTVAIPVRYDFNNWFGLQSEVSIIFKNYGIMRSWHYAANEYVYNNTFLDIPIFARFKFGGQKLHGYVLAGAYIGAWLESNIYGRQMMYFDQDRDLGGYEFSETVKFDSRRDNRFDGGLAAGLGLQYTINRKFGIFAEARYYYGLTDLQKDYMRNKIPRYNNTILLQIGVMYTFNK